MSGSQKIRWGALVLALVASQAQAQAGADRARWTVRAGADTLVHVHASGGAAAVALAQAWLAERGWFFARVDSVGIHTVHVTPGRAARVAALEVVGGSPSLTSDWSTREGDPFDADTLRADLARSAQRALVRGFPDATLRPTLEVDSAGVRIRVEVDEGARARLAGVEVTGGRRARPGLAMRLSGLERGAPYPFVDAEALRQDLAASGLFAEVGEPQLVRAPDGGLIVQVPVVDRPPGVFDLVLGYLPPQGATGGGVVGSGRLELRSPFGGGRVFDVALNRTPGLVSALDVSASDPFVAGLPVRLAAAFSGYARDSTFSRQRLRAEVGLRVARTLMVGVSVAREGVSPGVRVTPGEGERPRIVRSDAILYGVAIDYRAVSPVLAPRRGLLAAVEVAQGRRRRRPDAASGGTATAPLERRLSLTTRAFVPLLRRHRAVIGADASVVLLGRDAGDSEAAGYDEGDLFRFGGAASLRGYDEEALLGNVVGRLLAEYRLGLGPQTYAFAFGDLGYVDQPALPDRPEMRAWWPGYGAGLQLLTGVGLATVTYALNPDLPASRGKIHVGLSLGL